MVVTKTTKTSNAQVEIYIVRHGATPWTVSGQHTSYTDLPLTEEGRKEARSLRAKLKKISFTAVFSSPLKRAFDTCVLAGFARAAMVDHDLFEWNYGLYEGLTSKEIHAFDPDWTVFSKDPPEGETWAEIEKRADRMIEKAFFYGGRVLFFSSGHFSRALSARFLGLSVSYGKYLSLSTGSISRLGFEKDKKVILSWNK